MASLNSILRPQVLTNVISRQAGTSDWMLNLFGCQPGGANELNFGHGRTGEYNIFNNVRAVAKLRAPGTAAARRAPNPVGNVPFTYPRMHDSINLSAEVVHNLGRISDPRQRDIAGEEYVGRQMGTLSQLASNFRKAMLAGVLRDELHMVPDGDSYYFTFDNSQGGDPKIKVRTDMPAGNKGQLDMLGTGAIIDASWATATTNIPAHLWAINAAFQQLCGGHLAAVICPSTTWTKVTENDFVKDLHGTSSPPFETLRLDQLDPAVGETMLNVHVARLNTLPNTLWYITDEGMDLGPEGGETYQKLVPENQALFVGHAPSQGAVGCYVGSEPIAEYDGGPKVVKTGLNSWSMEQSDPTTTRLFALDNALVVNHVPASSAIGTVVF